MLNHFFKLNGEYEKIPSEEELKKHLKTSKHLCNLAFMPDELSDIKIDGLTFENFSFARTTLKKVKFINCKFKDCLFTGTNFYDVKIHDSCFENCNFSDCDIRDLYAKPSQFENVITDRKYANIASHLYNQLRNNYKLDSQKKFRGYCEYEFRKWESIYEFQKSKRNGENPFSYHITMFFSLVYRLLFGYGYKVKNTFITAISLVFFLTLVNFYLNDIIFERVDGAHTFVRSLYFTITTMVTLGPTGFNNFTELGYYIVIIDVLTGMLLFTLTINLIANRIIK